jgi:hypothetical protein
MLTDEQMKVIEEQYDAFVAATEALKKEIPTLTDEQMTAVWGWYHAVRVAQNAISAVLPWYEETSEAGDRYWEELKNADEDKNTA